MKSSTKIKRDEVSPRVGFWWREKTGAYFFRNDWRGSARIERGAATGMWYVVSFPWVHLQHLAGEKITVHMKLVKAKEAAVGHIEWIGRAAAKAGIGPNDS